MAATALTTLPPFVQGPRLIDGNQLNTMVGALNNIMQSGANEVVMIPVPTLAGLANAQVLKVVVGFPFSVSSIGFRTGAPPATTAAKAATLTAQISGVAMTGGVMALTSANQAATGTLTAGTAITALNTGSATATLEVAVSAVTTFVEGSGWVEAVVTNTAFARTN